jgi:hypothetical protein
MPSMITPRLRPRLDLVSPLQPAELAAAVERRLREPDCPCRGLTSEGQVELRIREAQRHFWSPQLAVTVEPSDGGSVLRGHFGPNANVWTMFMACYGFVTLSAITALFYGVSQLIVREPPWALWSLPIALVLIVLIYVAAGIGQRLGRDQVGVLESFLERTAQAERPDGPPAARNDDHGHAAC